MLFLTKIDDKFMGYVKINGVNLRVIIADHMGDIDSYAKFNNLKIKWEEPQGSLYRMKKVDKW